MAGVPEDDLVKIGPWPDGVNNAAKEHAVAPTALRKAVNVDIDKAGWPSLRKGQLLRIAATRAHSLFATQINLFALVDGALKAYDENLNLEATIKTGLGTRYISFTQALDDIYWTNGVSIRRIGADLSDHPAGLATPNPPAVSAAVSGGLAAGPYELSLTWRDSTGRESGASPSTVTTVAANGGLMLTNLPTAAEDAVSLCVYISPPDGEVLYLAYTVPAGQSTLAIGAHSPGLALKTAWHLPLPPGDIIRYAFGRVLVAASNQLNWSESVRPGLMHQDNTMRFGERITLMEPVGEGNDGSGTYIADHKRTYFLSGANPNDWQKVIRYPHAAVPGTSITLPGTSLGLETTAPVAFWLASNGVFCVGLPGGQVMPLRESELALPIDAEHGATMYREFDGLRQIITSFLAGGANAFGVTDSASATIRRNGVTVV